MGPKPKTASLASTVTQRPTMTQILIILFELSSESAELNVPFDLIQSFSVPWRDASKNVWGFMGWIHEYGEEAILIIPFPQLASLPGALQGPLAAPFHSIHGCDGGNVLCSVVQKP